MTNNAARRHTSPRQRAAIEALQPTSTKQSRKPAEITYVAIGPYGWGKGETPAEAVKVAKKHVPRSLLSAGRYPLTVYEVTRFLTVDGMGRIVYRGKTKPRELLFEKHAIVIRK